tara:strand:+ start:587 stop:823 length:237 start_codon:yes stop_codon:yes gene_type:complete
MNEQERKEFDRMRERTEGLEKKVARLERFLTEETFDYNWGAAEQALDQDNLASTILGVVHAKVRVESSFPRLVVEDFS